MMTAHKQAKARTRRKAFEKVRNMRTNNPPSHLESQTTEKFSYHGINNRGMAINRRAGTVTKTVRVRGRAKDCRNCK